MRRDKENTACFNKLLSSKTLYPANKQNRRSEVPNNGAVCPPWKAILLELLLHSPHPCGSDRGKSKIAGKTFGKDYYVASLLALRAIGTFLTE